MDCQYLFWCFIGEVWQGKVHNLPGRQAFCSRWSQREGHRRLCGDQGQARRKTGFYNHRCVLLFVLKTDASLRYIPAPYFLSWSNARSNIQHKLIWKKQTKNNFLLRLFYKITISTFKMWWSRIKTEEFQKQDNRDFFLILLVLRFSTIYA